MGQITRCAAEFALYGEKYIWPANRGKHIAMCSVSIAVHSSNLPRVKEKCFVWFVPFFIVVAEEVLWTFFVLFVSKR